MVWPVWVVQAIIAVAVIIVGELLRPKPKIEDPKPSALGDFNFPTATEGRAIPVVWGTVKIAGPNVVWYGDLKTVAIRKKQKTGLWSSKMVTIGFKYHLGIQHALCFGKIDEFIGFNLEDRAVTLGGKTVTTDTTTFTMDQLTLFGKEDQEGGVSGSVRVYHGTYTQQPNDYLEAKIGEPLPAYRPVCQVVFEGCYLGNSGRMPKPEFILRRTPNPLGLADGKHNIGGDANPANMIFEIMTDRVWGMGIPASLIDTDAFIAVGNTLAAEGFGLSMVVDNEQGGENLLSEIVRHIDGVVYNDFVTGKFKIALVRDDYNPETIPVYDESKITSGSLEFSRASWEDTQNTVKIKYVDREQNYTQRVIQHQDIANISVRGGQIEAEEYDFTGVSNPTLANKIAARVLQTVASPLSRVNFTATRHAASLRPGDVFKLSWAELGITSVVYRVTEVEYGTLDNPEVRVSAIEDIFSVSTVAYETPNPSGWTNPFGSPQDLSPVKMFEAPYAFIGVEERRAMIAVSRKMGQEQGYDVWSDRAGGVAYAKTNESVADFTPSGVLAADYPVGVADDAVGFTLTNLNDMEGVVSVSAAERAQGALLLLVDDELMSAQDVIDNGNGTVSIKKILRGVHDTIPAAHLAGATVWIVSHGLAEVDPATYYTANGTVSAKLLPYTSREQLPIGGATQRTVSLSQRAWKPYPPAKILVDGSATDDTVSGNATLTWAIRHRLLQTQADVVVSQDAASYTATPEGGFEVKVYIDGAVRRTVAVTAAPFDTFEYTPAMRVEDFADVMKTVHFGVRAVNGAHSSAERLSHSFFMLDALSPLTITTTSLPGASQGLAYSQQLEATGGATPYTWTKTAGVWPAGLSMSSSGLISGTPTSATESQTVTVQVEGPAGVTDTQVLTLVVSSGCADYTIPAATGTSYDITQAEVVIPATGNTLHICNATSNPPA